jgi:HAD superfamily hydrolase (TIGR01509 family)
MALKVITIDFWNTIFDSSNGTARNEYRISEFRNQMILINASISEEDYKNAMKSSWEYFNTIWKSEYRTPSTDETVRYFWRTLHLEPNEDSMSALVESFGDSVLYHPPKLLPGIEDALDELSNNYLLAIISDTGFSPGRTLRRLLQENDILRYFSEFSFSDETGVSKPHPKAYQKILNALECSPGEALHVGDIEETDIVGAKNLGMKAIRFTGDPTAMLNGNNPIKSLADFEAKTWEEILSQIKSINY